MARYDVLIVGVRCAGAPLALLLARKGYLAALQR
jgi:flavin-dependent dehydrogenase